MRYALSPFPPALFEARNVFRKADKPHLTHAIQDHASDAMLDCVPESTSHVLDGGSLLHIVPWQIGTGYGEIAKSYTDFAIRHYGPATTVVFDGYEEDNTHQRRGRNMHPVVSSTAEAEFSGKKEEFLSRDTNKQRLIRMISDQLRQRDCIVVNAHEDADVDIVKTAVETSLKHTTYMTLIGEDTDLLVLLLYYAQGEVMNLYFRSDKPKADGTIAVYLYHINRIPEVLGHEVCPQLMCIHALTDSDTTSRIFGVGKKTAFHKLAKGDPLVRSCAIAFTIPNQTTEVIYNLGCQVYKWLSSSAARAQIHLRQFGITRLVRKSSLPCRL